jgi:hypothetical protein
MTDLDLDADLTLGPDLHELMDRSLADLGVPTDRLQRGAVQQGRAVRRRRRVAGAVGAVAAVTLAALLVVTGSGGSDPTRTDVATEPPADAFGRPGWWDMPVGEMRDRLAALLPDDVAISDYERTNTDHAPGESDAWAGVFLGTLRDSADVGPGSIEVMLLELPIDAAARAQMRREDLRCAGFPETWDLPDLTDGAFCEEGEMRGGQPFRRTITYENQGVEYREVRRWTGQGEIYAAVSSSTERKWGPPASAIHAPLTRAELEVVAGSPTWQDWIPPRD